MQLSTRDASRRDTCRESSKQHESRLQTATRLLLREDGLGCRSRTHREVEGDGRFHHETWWDGPGGFDVRVEEETSRISLFEC